MWSNIWFVDFLFLLLQISFKVKLGTVGLRYRIVCYRRTLSNGAGTERTHKQKPKLVIVKNPPFIPPTSPHTDCTVVWIVIWNSFARIFMFAFWESSLQFFSFSILNGEFDTFLIRFLESTHTHSLSQHTRSQRNVDKRKPTWKIHTQKNVEKWKQEKRAKKEWRKEEENNPLSRSHNWRSWCSFYNSVNVQRHYIIVCKLLNWDALCRKPLPLKKRGPICPCERCRLELNSFFLVSLAQNIRSTEREDEEQQQQKNCAIKQRTASFFQLKTWMHSTKDVQLL